MENMILLATEYFWDVYKRQVYNITFNFFLQESVNNKQGSDPAQENNESLQKQEEPNQLFKGKQREPIKQ